MEKFLKDIKQWAENEEQVESIIVVGSYARGRYKETSDIDLVIINNNKKEMLKNQNFIKLFGDVNK